VKRFVSYLCFLMMGWGLTGCDLMGTDQAANDIAEFSPPAQVTAAQSEAVIRLEPATPQLNVGDTAIIEIRVDNVVNLFAADAQLQFNPAVLQVQDADAGREGVQIQPGNFPIPDFVITNVVTNTSGIINYAATDLAPLEPVSGSGTLARITFQAIAPGESEVTFSAFGLIGDNGQALPATSQAGRITVGQGPTSTPTNTPLPGQETATFTPIPIPLTPTATPLFTPTPTATPILATATPSPTPTPTPTNTPLAPQVVIPPGATVGLCYRVQPGDTLYSLGQKFGIEPGFINLVNDLHPPGHIYPQKILFMPTQYGTGPNVYQVQPGDTLASIAEQCQLDVDVLAYVNKLAPEANLAQIPALIIPRPPFAPPSRYPYPQVGPPSVWPPLCCPGNW
jgi:LysM repeat protein